ADRNRSHWSTSKTPSYTKSVSWQHHRHEMLPVNLTQETLFSSKSHGKYALFPIFTASWRAHRIMNKGV
ncbi:hypothetical protein RYZ44_13890, partial [Escherichia coli]|uniref:hypothetical protein n=1 Tax=Escherichia coli TaxID=562 RepID=UPI002963D1AD